MITISQKIKKDQMIMALTKSDEIRHVIAHTSKGDLTLMLRKGDISYTFCLDAVPYDDKLNNELTQLFDGILYTL